MLKKPFAVAAIAATVAIATLSTPAAAGDPLLGALVGAGIGSAVGHGISGRDGAWVGGALGAITGASVAANSGYYRYGERTYYGPPAPVYYDAPPAAYYPPAPVHYGPPVVYAPRYAYGPYFAPRYPGYGHVYAHGRYDWRDHGYRGR